MAKEIEITKEVIEALSDSTVRFCSYVYEHQVELMALDSMGRIVKYVKVGFDLADLAVALFELDRFGLLEEKDHQAVEAMRKSFSQGVFIDDEDREKFGAVGIDIDSIDIDRVKTAWLNYERHCAA